MPSSWSMYHVLFHTDIPAPILTNWGAASYRSISTSSQYFPIMTDKASPPGPPPLSRKRLARVKFHREWGHIHYRNPQARLLHHYSACGTCSHSLSLVWWVYIFVAGTRCIVPEVPRLSFGQKYVSKGLMSSYARHVRKQPMTRVWIIGRTLETWHFLVASVSNSYVAIVLRYICVEATFQKFSGVWLRDPCAGKESGARVVW